MATKKESAQRLRDSLESKGKLRTRFVFSVGMGAVFSIIIWILTRQWQFGIASLLVIGLLIQFASERMSNSIEASRVQALSDLGWKEDTLSDEEYLHRVDKILKG
ncbi:MAG: hypothetical protein L7U62_06525 [Candidatus Poseidoniaceae archaeon]|nr:hypothetical protein [Candidatus Poseidoniaceae archaeon]